MEGEKLVIGNDNDPMSLALRAVVFGTRYTFHQCMRVAEICHKWGDKAKWHMSKKQLDILNKIETAYTAVLKKQEEIQ